MNKIDRIFNYLNENKDKSKPRLIKEIMEKFNVTEISAPIYYTQWKTYRKKQGLDVEAKIILRPLDLEKSNVKVTIERELDKCTEEDTEFAKGVLNGDIENTIEEFWDSVQAKLNVISMMGISTDVIYMGLDKHIKKMNKRGYLFKEN